MAATAFLHRLTWAKVWLDFYAAGKVWLPAYCGSAVRGALGRLFRLALCEQRPTCPGECQHPESCRYYWLFERSREQGDRGANIPKPWVLSVPPPPGLEQIIWQGRVCAPYRLLAPREGELVPALQNSQHYCLNEGDPFRIGLTFIGQAAALAIPIIELLARTGLRCGGLLRLERAIDAGGGGRILYERGRQEVPVQPPQLQAFVDGPESPPEGARRLRVVFRTPCLLKSGQETCWDPQQVVSVLLEQCMVRAVRLYNTYFTWRYDRLPWQEAPGVEIRLVGHRLFRYVLPRVSFRQNRRMRFDGLVGTLDLEGELQPVLPFLRAAEVLHVGQKATFGLGEITCWWVTGNTGGMRTRLEGCGQVPSEGTLEVQL